jgi:ferritin-like metal-binding protein YciE
VEGGKRQGLAPKNDNALSEEKEIEPMAERGINTRDLKLVQWLNEAYAKEAELEADLTAHIALTQKDTYKKRLRKHLTETRDHKKRVAARMKKLGGSATVGPHIPGVPEAVGEVAGKTVAAVKGQLGTARAAVTSQAETHLRNAQEELREEHVEIAIYSRIETFATEVGDRETAQLAKSIRRDEERMAKFLNAELTRLVKEVVRNEVPREERATARRSGSGRSSSRSGSSSRSRSSSSGSRSTRSSGSSRGTSASGSSRSSGSRSTSSRSSGSTSPRNGSSGSSRSGSSRGGSSRSGGSGSRSGTSSRSRASSRS